MSFRGSGRAFLAFDIGFSVDLEAAAARLPSLPLRVVLRHRGRDYPLGTGTSPLRVSQRRESIQVGSLLTLPEIELTLFDFGAVSVCHRFPLALGVEELPALSQALYGNPALLEDARAAVVELVGSLGDAVREPALQPLVEDYVVFRVPAPPEPESPSSWLEAHARAVAGALRAETDPLSAEEVADAVSLRIAYGERDLTLVDWFAALLVGDEMEDEVAVLEFATVELLALRVLDRTLDQGLEEAARQLRAAPRFHLLRGRGAAMEGVARLQADAAFLLEGATNPAKLVGDQYLARMYRKVATRFHLAEWGAAVDRKLEALDSAYQKLTDRDATRRLETLEWIIIVLIALSIAIYFVPLP